jgi:tetratricopeptide (TPR) repeat protein
VVAERVHKYAVSVEERAHAAQVEAAESRVREVQERKRRRLTLALAASILGTLVVGGGGFVWVQNERAAAERAEVARAAAAEREEAARIQAQIERERELAADVNRTLEQASLLRGQERWADALLAVERARALAEGGDASDELVAHIEGVATSLGRAEEEARARDELRRDTELLLAELEEIRAPEWGEGPEGNRPPVERRARGDRGMAEAYAATFLGHGIDLDAGESEAAAETLLARGLGSEIALQLDSWSLRRRAHGDEAGAVRLLEIAHMVDPDVTRANLREAMNNGDLDVLLWIVEDGFDDQPPNTIELLATGLERLDRRDAAWDVYRRGITLYPDSFSLQFGLARMLTPEGADVGPEEEMRAGVRRYLAALALKPDSLMTRFGLGQLYGKLGQPEDAVEHYEICLEERPDDGVFLYNLGHQLLETGQLDRAQPLFERALELAKNEWWGGWSCARLGRIAGRRGALALAVDWFEKAIYRLPRTQRIHSELAILLLEAQSHEEAERVLLRAERQFPDSAEVQNNLAWTLATAESEEARDIEEAVRRGERAVELEPTEATYWNTLGVARYRAGDMEGTVRDLMRSVELGAGGFVEDWLFLAMAHHELGDEVEARGWYERSVLWLELNPGDDPERQRFLAEAKALLAER